MKIDLLYYQLVLLIEISKTFNYLRLIIISSIKVLILISHLF